MSFRLGFPSWWKAGSLSTCYTGMARRDTILRTFVYIQLPLRTLLEADLVLLGCGSGRE